MSHDGEPDGTSAGPLARLQGLDDLPVSDHVAAFEAVHDALRSQLDAPAQPAAGETER